MKKNYNSRKLKAKKSYSTRELAEAFQVHVQTVRSWESHGLQPIDSASHKSFYLGSAVSTFIKKQQADRRVKLAPNEFYCFGCRRPTTSVQTTVASQEVLIGYAQESIRLGGVCVTCGRKINRFDSKNKNELVTAKVINPGLSASL